jgi:arylsulfatase A-like enzyme
MSKTDKTFSNFSRRDFLKTSAFLGAGLAIPGWSSNRLLAEEAQNQKLNVVILKTDQHSPHVLGCYGNPIIQTPNFDALAQSGTRFTNNYCQNPVSVASRASFITGKMPHKVRIYENIYSMLPNVTWMSEIFAKAGYSTDWIGKTHWGGKNRGFAAFYPEGRQPRYDSDFTQRYGKGAAANGEKRDFSWRSTDIPFGQHMESCYTDDALSFIDKNKNKPFFLGLSFARPHFPYTINKEYYDFYKAKVELPAFDKDAIARLMPSDLENYKAKFSKVGSDNLHNCLRAYYGMVQFVDAMHGRVVKKLDQLGIREKTIVVYIADHGELGGEHGLWHKSSFYEASVRVPMIISGPGLPQGKVVESPSQNIDIFPTVCEMCGLKAPGDLDGVSLVPVLKGQVDGKDRVVLSESNKANGAMARFGDWKYVRFGGGEEFLFNLATDPNEMTNVVKDSKNADVVDQLRKKVHSNGFSQMPVAQLKKWQSESMEGEKIDYGG